MGFIAKEPEGSDYPIPPMGSHVAVCVQVIDLGTQYSKFYDKSAHKILLGWELIGVETESDHACIAFRRYTLSLHENAALRGHLESWRGKTFTAAELDGFDVSKILGVPCLVNITHRQDGNKTYADVAAVMALPKGTAKPDSTTEHLIYDIDNHDQATFDKFGDNLKATIERSEERQGQSYGASATDGPKYDGSPMTEQDIPF